jgi:PDDEXK-like domain of unknown function (DUF3799)
VITNEQYHADTSRISKSGIDVMNECPANYYYRYLSGLYKREETAATALGTLFHTMVLEPENIARDYVVVPASAPAYPGSNVWNAANPSKDSIAAMNFWRQFKEVHGGKKIVEQSDIDNVQRMRDAIMKHPAGAELLSTRGIVERTTQFTDPEIGAPCKCRPDFEHPAGIIIDLKSTEDASPDGFGRSSYNYRYHVQAPFYMDGLNVDAGFEKITAFVFIAVEKNPPYNVGVYFADEGSIELGRRDYKANLARYMQCLKTGEWPAYSAKIEPLQIPTWAYKL